MEKLWILIFVAFLAKETEQQMLSVKTNSDSQLQASEKDEIELTCIIKTAGRPTRFQWLLAGNLITNGTEIANLSDSDNYLVSLIERKGKNNVFDYNLRINQVSRTHHGRWTCRAIENTETIEKVNIVLTVAYVPDQMYPICEMADLSLICETQEGNPRVSLEWYAESVEQQFNVKPSASRTIDGIIHSEVWFSSLRPPNWMKDYVVCETDFGNCSISKEDVYNQTELFIFKEEQEKIVFVHCNVSNTLNEGSLVFEWGDPLLEGKMTLHEGQATLTFQDEGFGYKEEIVVCRYLWGIMDNIAVSIVVNIPIAPPLHSSTEVATELIADFLSTKLMARKTPPTSDDHFLHSTSQISSTSKSVESTSTSAKYGGVAQTVETTHYFSTSKPITSPEESLKSTLYNQKMSFPTKIFTTQIPVETYDTDSGTTTSTSILDKTTLYPNNRITTVLMNPKSTDLMEEIISSSDKPRHENTTIPRVTETNKIRRTFTFVNTEERTVTPQATTKGLELSTRPEPRVTEKTTILEAKPTLPLLPPESNIEPADGGRNISLLLISLIVIFVVLLIAVIVYQKWKEKTGSYSLPNSTSPNVKNPSASTFRPKPEYSY